MLEVNSKFKRPSSKAWLIIAGAAILILGVAAGYFFWQYSLLKSNPNLTAEETTKRLVAKVGKIYQLPSDEQPTVAQIQDKEKLSDQLKSQDFFKPAQNNDFLLIYSQAKLAILYREKENKIINVGPLSAASETQNGQTTQSSSPAPSTQTAPPTPPRR